MVASLIQQAFDKKKSFRQGGPAFLLPTTLPADGFPNGIPTLNRGGYRKASPMMSERFALFGRWTNATHGLWLGVPDMEALWNDPVGDPVLQEVRDQRISGEENWPNEVSALFRPERLSLFAGSDLGNEKIYLLWLDFEDEPELWVYDANGESRYRDLKAYLEAYLADDVSASQRPWRAGP